MQFNAESAQKLDDGFIPGFCTRSQRLIKTLATEAGVFSELAPAASLGNVRDCLKKNVRSA